MKLKFFKIVKIKLSKLLRIKTITVADKYYDYMTDNDDYDDESTLIDVTYSGLLGIIISKRFSTKNEKSSLTDIQNFYDSCHINEYGGLDEYKKYSIYK